MVAMYVPPPLVGRFQCARSLYRVTAHIGVGWAHFRRRSELCNDETKTGIYQGRPVRLAHFCNHEIGVGVSVGPSGKSSTGYRWCFRLGRASMYTALERCRRPSRFRGRCTGRGHIRRSTGLDVTRQAVLTMAKVAIVEVGEAGYYAWFWHGDGRWSSS